MNVPAASEFYISGGTLPQDALSYVRRQADDLLHTALLQGEFCYILTPRQMGKSSLMAHTARRLRDEGVSVAVIDLSAIGYEMDSEQWYNGLLDQLGRRLGLEDELEDFYLEHERLSPLQRWVRALRDVVLERIAGRIIIFLDEIDIVRSLPFSADEFFAAIRACFNARTEDSAYQRLTFCLLGVATPSDLIRNPKLTPFNIGKRIDLHDFTAAEAAQLQVGLGHDMGTNQRLMERIYYWTAGHPYLTQRLCKVVASDTAALTERGVDGCCRQLFLASEAEHRDDNLLYVQQRLLPEEEEERASLLTLYAQVLSGKRVADNPTAPQVNMLKLSGVVGAQNEALHARNRIYRQVFDRKWVAEHMPGAELRRQRAAYFLGILRTVAVSLFLLTCIGSLALFAFNQARYARAQTRLAKEAEARTKRLLYASDMNVVQQAYDKGEYGRLSKLLEAQRPKPGEKDLRGFEWRYYWWLMHRDQHTLTHPGKGIVFSVAFSPEGKILASAKEDGTIKLWDTTTWRKVTTLQGPAEGVFSLAISPNGRWLAAGCLNKTVQVWDVATQRVIKTLAKHKGKIYSVAFSQDGRWLASGGVRGELKLWDVTTWHEVPFPKAHKEGIYAVVFLRDGRWLASGGDEGEINLWNVATRHTMFSLPSSPLYSLAASPDSKMLMVGRDDGNVEIWNVSSKSRIAVLPGHKDTVNGLAFSPDRRYLATGSWDETIRLWDVAARNTVHTFIGHTNRVTSVAFSPNGRWLASVGSDEVKIWDPQDREKNPIQLSTAPDMNLGYPGSLTFSHSGALRQFFFMKNYTVKLWDCTEGRIKPIYPTTTRAGAAAFSPDGRTLALGTGDGKVILSDATSRKPVEPSIQVDMRLIENHGVSALAFSPDGRMLAAASGDPTFITVLEIISRREIAHFEISNGGEGIAFSPDGKTLAAANWQGRVYLWDLATKKETVWWAHAKPVTAVAFSPDGKTLATASEDNTVKLWNMETKREMITLTGPKDPVRSVAFSPDGNQLAALSDDKKVYVWMAASLAEADRQP